MFLDFGRLQTHPFTNDQQDTAPDSRLVDVANTAIPGAFNALGRLAVDHDWTSSYNLIDFGRRGPVLEVAAVEPEFFLDPLHLGIRWLIVTNVEFSTDHVSDQDGKRLSRTASSPNRSSKVHGYEL